MVLKPFIIDPPLNENENQEIFENEIIFGGLTNDGKKKLQNNIVLKI